MWRAVLGRWGLFFFLYEIFFFSTMRLDLCIMAAEVFFFSFHFICLYCLAQYLVCLGRGAAVAGRVDRTESALYRHALNRVRADKWVHLVLGEREGALSSNEVRELGRRKTRDLEKVSKIVAQLQCCDNIKGRCSGNDKLQLEFKKAKKKKKKPTHVPACGYLAAFCWATQRAFAEACCWSVVRLVWSRWASQCHPRSTQKKATWKRPQTFAQSEQCELSHRVQRIAQERSLWRIYWQ